MDQADQAKPDIIIVAYHFPPAPEIGGARPFRFCKYLTRMGYCCHVITASAQDGTPPPDVTFLPDTLRGVWERNEPKTFWANVELLIRKAMFPGQIGFIWSAHVVGECRRILRRHPDRRFVLFSTYPPLGVLLTGLFARLRTGVPWIADFRDPLAGLVLDEVPSYARFWNRVLEKWSFREANAILANAEGAAAQWRARYPEAASKLHVIWNGFDPENTPHARGLPTRHSRMLLHAGVLYHGRNPNIIIASLSRLRQNGVPEAASIHVVLLGAIDHKAGLDTPLYEQAQREGWLELRSAVPKAESQRLMEEADGLLLVQPQTDIQVPGKLFEYICIGRPILALVPQASAVEHILAQSGIANVCIYGDDPADGVDRKLLEFLRLPSTPTPYSAWFEKNFNAGSQAEQLAAIIKAVDSR